MLAVCVDVGQTKTSVVIYDDNGNMTDRWIDEPVTNYAKVGGMDTYKQMAANVLDRLNKKKLSEPVSVCFSLTGYHGDVTAIPQMIEETFSNDNRAFNLISLSVVPDYWGNWYSVTKGAPGVVVICGGGTVAYGRNSAGQSIRLGGWGHLLGDEGSGYWIGLEAVKSALKSQVGITEPTDLGRSILEALNLSEESRLLAAFNSGQIKDKDLALLAPLVNEWASKGDPEALRIMEEGAGYLFELSKACSSQLGGDIPIYLSGGVFKASIMMEKLLNLFHLAGMGQWVSKSDSDPAEGIYILVRNGVQ